MFHNPANPIKMLTLRTQNDQNVSLWRKPARIRAAGRNTLLLCLELHSRVTTLILHPTRSNEFSRARSLTWCMSTVFTISTYLPAPQIHFILGRDVSQAENHGNTSLKAEDSGTLQMCGGYGSSPCLALVSAAVHNHTITAMPMVQCHSADLYRDILLTK